MKFPQLLKIEFMKVKRSKIAPLIFIAPILVVVSGIANLRAYLTPEYANAYGAMFIQSALVYAYYLLPLSMIVVCVMIDAREGAHGGLVKMLSLPIGRRALSMAKFVVAAFYLFLEMAVFFGVFSVAGPIAAHSMGVREALPAALLAAWCAGLFVSMLPCLALIWAVCVLFENSALSVGLNLVLVIPGVLVANTPAYIIYPYCYSGYLVSCYLDRFASAGATDPLSLVPFLPCAAALFGAALFAAAALFGKKAMR